MDNNDFILKIVAELEKKGIKTGYDKLKKELEKDPAKIDVILNTSGTVGKTKGSIKKLAAELHNELSVEIAKLQKQGQNINFDLSVGDVEEVIQNVINHTKKLEQNFDSASAKAQKFLSQFNKKSGGTLVNSAEYKSVQEAIDGLGNTHSIDELNQSMNTLEITYNNMVSSLRNSGKSLNPFINAKNEMAVMDETIKGIGLEFEKLSTKPKSVSDAIKQLSVQQANVNSYTIGTQEWADAYGRLQQMIQKVKSEISNLQKAQSANVSTQIFNTADLDKQGKVYIQKVRNTIEAIRHELESKLRSAGYTDIEIKGVEKANGQIKSLTATVTDATGAFKQLNFQREKIQGNGKAQFGFVQTDDVKVIGTLSSSVEKVQGNLTTLKSKWKEQGVLIGDFKAKVEQLETSLSSVGNKGELNGLKSQIEVLKTEASQITQANKIQLSMEGKGKVNYNWQVDEEIKKLRNLGFTEEEASQKVKILADAHTELKNVINSNNFDSIESKNRAIIESDEKRTIALNQVKNAYRELKTDASQYYNLNKQTKLSTDIQNWLSKNSRASKEAKQSLQEYYRELSSGRVSVDRLNYIEKELKTIDAQQRGLGRLGKSLTDQFKQASESFTQWLSVSSAIMALVYQIKKIPEEVIKVNSAMVELRKVSDASDNEIKNYFDEAAESAKKLGASVSDLINATADWSRLGYSLPDSKKLAEVATLYTNVGDGIDMNAANESLISTLQGFQLEAEDAIGIIDKFNEVANNFPIDSAGIGEALQRSAASFYAANTDLSKSIALITGTNAVVQDPDSVGNMWKTVGMRIRGTKQELEEAGEETDGMVESTAELRDLIKSLTGFDIMIDEAGTQFKDVYDIVVGIGHEWKNLTDIEQAGLLETLAGKRQGNALSAALNNISMIEEAYKTAENSAGSALREQEEYEKGIQYSLNRLEASFQTFANHILDSDFLKGIVDFGNGAINIIDQITSALGSLGTIGLGAGIFAGFKNVGSPKMFGLNNVLNIPTVY